MISSNSKYDLSRFSNIVSIKAAGTGFDRDTRVIGLKADGTVVATGSNYLGVCDVSSWRDIVIIEARDECTIAIKKDGTVITAGVSPDLRFWTNIVAVSVNISSVPGLSPNGYIAGLRADGTVEIESLSQNRLGNERIGAIDKWQGITKIVATPNGIAGLRTDGSVVSEGEYPFSSSEIERWTSITEVKVSDYDTIIGLKSDGTLVAYGDSEYGACDVLSGKVL